MTLIRDYLNIWGSYIIKKIHITNLDPKCLELSQSVRTTVASAMLYGDNMKSAGPYVA